MRNRFDKHPVAYLVLVNLLMIGFILLGVEIYTAHSSEDGYQNIYIESFCTRVEENDYRFTDKTIYKNDSDGIFRLDSESPHLWPDYRNKFNASGFAGHDLVPVDTERQTVLFIGDSHTHGIAADPLLEKRFTTRVEDQGYYSYNAGTIGNDVVQYGLIARKHIPQLKPDYVALMLYPGNDVGLPPSPVAPGKHLHFQVAFQGKWNFVRGYDNYGESFDNVYEAVDYWLKEQCGSSLNAMTRLFMKSGLFRKAYALFRERRGFSARTFTVHDGSKWVAETIAGIKALSVQNGSEFRLFVIPEKNRLTTEEIEGRVHFLREHGLEPLYPETLTITDFQEQGAHMLNSGHEKYADFILAHLVQ